MTEPTRKQGVGTLSGPPNHLASWFLESLEAAQSAEGSLRDALLELRHILRAGDLDAGTRANLLQVLDGLEQATGRLTLLQTSARTALDDLLDQNREQGPRRAPVTGPTRKPGGD